MRPARLRTPLATTLTTLLAVTLLGPFGDAARAGAPVPATPAAVDAAAARNPVTPGNFRGYGFDQCLAPTQAKMNSLAAALAVPRGGHLHLRRLPRLPSPAQPHAQVDRDPAPQGLAAAADHAGTAGLLPAALPALPRRLQDQPGAGRREPLPHRPPDGRRRGDQDREGGQGARDRRRARTLWYDLEGFDATNRHCRESALAFLSTWTRQLHELNYVSGVYSSAGSGIKVLDDARVNRPNAFKLPDRIWIARWDGVANTSTSYIREDGWRPGRRVKQYQGGHDEVWGGVRINIDRNWLDLGTRSKAAAGDPLRRSERELHAVPGAAPAGRRHVAASVQGPSAPVPAQGEGHVRRQDQWHLQRKATIAAVRAWQTKRGFKASNNWSRRDWITLHDPRRQARC